MKPLLIAFKKDNRIAVVINSQDIKVIHIGEPKEGRFQGSIQLSGEEVGAPFTQHTIDKMKSELRQRYTLVHVDTFGVKVPTPEYRRGRSQERKNFLFEIKVQGRGVYYVFPKALRTVQANGTQLHMDAYGKTIRLNMTNRPDVSGLQFLAYNVANSITT